MIWHPEKLPSINFVSSNVLFFLQVTDTPGLFDTNLDCNASREIARCLGMIVPGPHAIVVVLRLGMKFTEEEAKVIGEVRKMFGEQLARYLVIVFTHGEQLHNNLTGEDSSLEALKIKLADAPDSLKWFIEVRDVILINSC